MLPSKVLIPSMIASTSAEFSLLTVGDAKLFVIGSRQQRIRPEYVAHNLLNNMRIRVYTHIPGGSRRKAS